MTENIAENFTATLVTDPKNESVIYVERKDGEKYPLDISQFSNKETLEGKEVHVTRDKVRNKITMVYKERILYQTPLGDEARDQLETIPGFMKWKYFKHIPMNNLDEPEREGARMRINYYYNLNKNIEQFKNWKNFEKILEKLERIYAPSFHPDTNKGTNVEKIFRENLDNYSINEINEMSEYLTSLLNGEIDSNESKIDYSTDTRIHIKIKVKDAFDEYMEHIEKDKSNTTVMKIKMKILKDFSQTTDSQYMMNQKNLRFYMYVKKLHTVYSKLKPYYEVEETKEHS